MLTSMRTYTTQNSIDETSHPTEDQTCHTNGNPERHWQNCDLRNYSVLHTQKIRVQNGICGDLSRMPVHWRPHDGIAPHHSWESKSYSWLYSNHKNTGWYTYQGISYSNIIREELVLTAQNKQAKPLETTTTKRLWNHCRFAPWKNKSKTSSSPSLTRSTKPSLKRGGVLLAKQD